MAVSVSEAHAVDDELVDAFARLTPQLSRSNPPPTRGELEEIVRSAASRLLVARDDNAAIVGSLTLVVFRIPQLAQGTGRIFQLLQHRIGSRSSGGVSRPTMSMSST